MIKKITFIFFLLLLNYTTSSQILTVINKETKETLEQVTIFNKQTNNYVTTNGEGQADISDFINAETLEVRFLGFKTKIKSYEAFKQNNFLVHLTPTILRIDEIVISATKWKQKTSDLATKVTVISPKAIALMNTQTAADLLTVSGKVFMQKSQQGGGSPLIRGFATNRLLYTIDGVRMNNAIFRAGNIQNVISLDPFAIEETEIIFGPGSVIYGSDAIGAVMSFKTLSPSLSLDDETLITGNALTRFSSANEEKTYHADFNLGYKKWAFVTSLSYNDYGDLRMGSDGLEEYLRNVYVERQNNEDIVITNKDPKIQTPSGYTQTNLMQKVRFKPNEKWNFEYGFHLSETSSYSRYDRHLRTKDGNPRYGEWSYGPQKWMMNNFEINKKGSNSFYDDVTLRLTYQKFDESRISRDFNDNERETRTERVDAYSTNLDFSKSLSAKSKLFYGTEYVYNDVNSTGVNTDIDTNISQAGPSRYPDSNWSSLGVYVSNQYNHSKKWVLQSGLRYNFYSLNATFDTTFYPLPFTEANINDGALTGSLGLVFRPKEDWLLSTNFSTAFRSPNVDDVGKIFDSEPGSVVVPNPDLKAEYAYNTDVSVAKTFGDYLKLEVTGFYTHLKDAMVKRDYTLNGETEMLYDGELSTIQAIQNAANAHVYGFQTGFEAELGSGIGFSSTVSYQKGEEELDNGDKSPSRHAAPWFGSTRLTYNASKLKAQLYADYSGSVAYEDLPDSEKAKDYMYAIDANGNPYSPSYITLNLKTSYRFTDNLLISTGLENITDKRYRPYSSGIVSPGRNFVISLKANI
ncbi:TonB-dependent receptor [Polaribacter sp. HaHaR_3_91]|uniref:TonB-dependent receptor n=1 Tax=Polaribacter sp. HaHaR_3_91 TaxID=2745561 RepID=UPI001C4E72E0|nr:TonB-dependent receptor [Polaribacter sp. HaHaR_3_91]QXP64403.1 TonB-dependent receptor [Polaribacter sp. HaHaR_3_91]